MKSSKPTPAMLSCLYPKYWGGDVVLLGAGYTWFSISQSTGLRTDQNDQ